MLRMMSAAAAAAVATLLQALPAQAHTELLRATPAPGSAVAESPDGVSLTFSEEVDPAFSGLSLLDEQGGIVPLKDFRIEGEAMDATVSEALGEGIYRLDWHLLSIDGHRVEGSFTFEVAP